VRRAARAFAQMRCKARSPGEQGGLRRFERSLYDVAAFNLECSAGAGGQIIKAVPPIVRVRVIFGKI